MTGERLDLGPIEVDDFAEFWAVYPRHKDRARAEASYRRARHVASAEVILAAAREYAAVSAGKPAAETRWAVEWLRSEPWRPDPAPEAPSPASIARRRRGPSKPRRAPRRTAPARPVLRPEERFAELCRSHGITVDEYHQRKEEPGWLDRIKRRGIVA